MKSKLLWRDQSGTTAVEFAILAPVFFLFLFGIIGFGLLFWTQAGLQHGAEMAARCASVNATLCPTGTPSSVTAYAAQQAFGLNLPASTFSYVASACGNQVTATYNFMLPAIVNLNPITLTAQSCFPA